MVITQTPLRVSFLGGGTDFAEYYSQRSGYVVTAAIDKYVFVIVKERFDDLIYVNYSRKEIVSSVAEVQHEFVREAMLQTGISKGLEITMLADIPAEGSGLGSSSSTVVGLLNALYAHKGIQVPAEQLAREACDIEIGKCKKPIGKQDQYIAAYGGLRAFRFSADESVDVEDLEVSRTDMRRLESSLMLFYTGVTRKAADILAAQKENVAAKRGSLDSLADLAVRGREVVKAASFDRLGLLIDEGWQLKKTLAASISNGVIEEMYAKAKGAGATGAKVCGAGGGGFLMLSCPPEKQRDVQQALAGYRQVPFSIEHDGSKVIFNYRRSAWI